MRLTAKFKPDGLICHISFRQDKASLMTRTSILACRGRESEQVAGMQQRRFGLRWLMLVAVFLLDGWNLGAAEEPVAATWEEAYQRLQPLEEALSDSTASKPELEGKVLTGYQGWFGAEGDGSGLGWQHYGGATLGPGRCTFDLWPDVSELDPDEKFPTRFQFPDGSPAFLFSSYREKTVERHFRWMKDYGIDGAFVQRFGVTLRRPRSYDFVNTVLRHARRGAHRHGRVWAVMYDLSGLREGELLLRISEDWRRLVRQARIREEAGYLHHRGKPVIAVWGVGFSDGRRYTLDECRQLMEFLQHDPECGGNAVLLGVPYFWRELTRDAVSDPALHALLQQADIVSPWSVGRYASPPAARDMVAKQVREDLAWCRTHGRSYLPVIFPGFSWHNLEKARGRSAPLNAIPRHGGQFLWNQAVAAIQSGATAIYVAMFDEVDEGTAILKAGQQAPVGESPFITYEGLPADHYLWLTGKIGRLLRGERPPSFELPTR